MAQVLQTKMKFGYIQQVSGGKQRILKVLLYINNSKYYESTG